MPLRVVTKLCFRKPFHRLNISMRINSAAPSGNALPSLRHSLPCRCDHFFALPRPFHARLRHRFSSQGFTHAHQCIADAALCRSLRFCSVRNFATTVRCGASTDHYSSTPEPSHAPLCFASASLSVAMPLRFLPSPFVSNATPRPALPSLYNALLFPSAASLYIASAMLI